MTCIFIDDEAAARMILEQLCISLESIDVIDQFSNAIDAIKFLNKNDVDLIFLDIHMPGFTGFDFIQTLKNPPKIILTTSDRDFAIEAFEYESIVDYLVKPLSLARLIKAVDKARVFKVTAIAPITQFAKTAKKNTDNDLYVNIDRRLIKISIPTIKLIQAKGDYIQIKTEDKNYTVHTTLKKIEEKLPDELFLKVHRSYIINSSKIIDIEDNSVLIDRDVIPVSRSNRPELMRRLNLL